MVSQNLGWTGSGRCEGGEIGSGEMRLFADVINPYMAIKSILIEFNYREVPEKPTFSIMYKDEIIEGDYQIEE